MNYKIIIELKLSTPDVTLTLLKPVEGAEFLMDFDGPFQKIQKTAT